MCGDRNAWSATAPPLTRGKDGPFAVSVSSGNGRRCRFRHLFDDGGREDAPATTT